MLREGIRPSTGHPVKVKALPPLPQPDETVNRQVSHIDLLGVSNHWGNRLFSSPLLGLFAEQVDGSLSQHQAFLLLIDVDLIKIPAFRMARMLRSLRKI